MLSVILAALMVLTVMPMTVFAEEWTCFDGTKHVKTCPFCGEVHGSDIFEKTIKFIHYLYYYLSLLIRSFD